MQTTPKAANTKKELEKIKECIALGRLDLAIKSAKSIFLEYYDTDELKSHARQLLIISSQHSLLLEGKLTLAPSDFAINHTQICDALLKVVDRFQDDFNEYINSESLDRSKKEGKAEEGVMMLTIHKDFESYTEEEQKLLLEAIVKLLSLKPDEVRVILKKKGSVELFLSLPKDKMVELEKVIEEKKLDMFFVESAVDCWTMLIIGTIYELLQIDDAINQHKSNKNLGIDLSNTDSPNPWINFALTRIDKEILNILVGPSSINLKRSLLGSHKEDVDKILKRVQRAISALEEYKKDIHNKDENKKP